jgi:hypothetical protein
MRRTAVRVQCPAIVTPAKRGAAERRAGAQRRTGALEARAMPRLRRGVSPGSRIRRSAAPRWSGMTEERPARLPPPSWGRWPAKPAGGGRRARRGGTAPETAGPSHRRRLMPPAALPGPLTRSDPPTQVGLPTWALQSTEAGKPASVGGGWVPAAYAPAHGRPDPCHAGATRTAPAPQATSPMPIRLAVLSLAALVLPAGPGRRRCSAASCPRSSAGRRRRRCSTSPTGWCGGAAGRPMRCWRTTATRCSQSPPTSRRMSPSSCWCAPPAC